MAQRRIVLGVILLLATIVVPLIEWVTLATVRTNKFLDDRGVPRVNAFNRQPGQPILSKPLTTNQKMAPVTDSGPVDAGTGAGRRELSAEQANRDTILAQDISGTHSWQITIGYRGKLVVNPMSNPTFSPDEQSIVVAQGQAGTPQIAIYSLRNHTVAKSWQPPAIPTAFGWSPDGKRLAYRAGRDIHIVEIETQRDILLPLSQYFGEFPDALLWPSVNTLVYVGSDRTYKLDLDSLSITDDYGELPEV
jgi:WD40-like Beta Propeller Repeat